MYEYLENNKNFLQSEEWRRFQESVGQKTFLIKSENFIASIIEHKLPLVGKYFYVPKGPALKSQKSKVESQNCNLKLKSFLIQLTDLAKKENAGWIRIEPENAEILNLIKKNTNLTIVKAPHDTQPKETLIIDITKSEEELLAEMKSKTRYNIKLAQKHKVSVQAISNFQFPISNKNSESQKLEAKSYFEEFLRLTKIMSERQGITTHSDKYYRKMFEIIPQEMIKLYVAEYEGPASTRGDDRSSTRGREIIAANLVTFYGDTATYSHGASDDKYKNLMAPYLLQWQQIQDAKEKGCLKYDFGGVKVNEKYGRSWAGITKFKLGFSPNTSPIEFPGCYDIVVSPVRYWIYRILQFFKSFIG